MLVDIWNVSGQVVLLSDTLRVDSYREAIRRKVAPGDVVVDIGSGAGVMARFAALAGASRVIAIEAQAELCELNERTNQMLGLHEVIEVVHGRAEEVHLGERVDVVISELIGSLVDDEDMSQILTGFLAAHREDLASDVRFVPEEVVLYGRVVEPASGVEATSSAEQEGAAAFERALAGEVLVLTDLRGLELDGEAFQLLVVDGMGRRTGGHGRPVPGFSGAGLRRPPRMMACWFESRLADGVHLDSRGNSMVSTTWGWPLVPLVGERAPGSLQEGVGELRFRLERLDDGELAVEAAVG